ncbi:MAG TPA: type II CAAX endopeptidase family protein [Chloroflexota bacterium]|nr:type II CAAX endopeptidase family protein [Chloroflexota bacterium]
MTAGGKVFLAGLAIAVAGTGLLLARGPRPTSLAAAETNPNAGLLGLGLAIATLGCFIYVLQPTFDKRVARRLPYATVRTAAAMLVVAVAVANLLSLPLFLSRGQAAETQGPALGPLGLAYAVVASEVPILAVVWLRLVVPRCRNWRELGLRWQPLLDHVQRGLLGGVALFIAAAAVGAVLTRLGVRQNQFERFQGIEGAPLPLFLLALAAGCVLAPFVEELFFRGYVFQTFSERYHPAWAYLFSAGLFAVVHANLAAAAPIFVLGLMLAYIFKSSGSIIPGAIAHGVNNAISFWLLYTGLGR